MSAFDEWYAHFLYYEGEPTRDIAKQAWDAAFQRMTVADNQTLAALKHEGYVLVPIEPTEKMIDAWWDTHVDGETLDEVKAYKAMIQAAQIED